MRLPILVHVVGGGLALVSGFVALYAAKGARTHRASGTLFVYAMLVMSLTGAAIAAVQGGEGSVIAGVTTAYLVVTALTTMRTPAGWTRRTDVGLMVLALVVGSTSLALGVATVASPTGTRDGLPPFPFFMFGIVGLLGAAGDLRVLRAGTPRGTARLRRHLWRMCWALWIATSSFFLGQAKVFPAAIRKPPLLAIPVLLVLVTMLWWLWRTRSRRRAAAVVAEQATGTVAVRP